MSKSEFESVNAAVEAGATVQADDMADVDFDSFKPRPMRFNKKKTQRRVYDPMRTMEAAHRGGAKILKLLARSAQITKKGERVGVFFPDETKNPKAATACLMRLHEVYEF